MRTRLALVAALSLVAMAAPPPAIAGRPVTITVAEIGAGAWNQLEVGWTTDDGATRHPLVDNQLGDATYPILITAPVVLDLSHAERVAFHVYLRDVSCDRLYLDDGTPVDHAATSQPARVKGRVSTTYYFSDAGGYPSCPYATTTGSPSSTNWNGVVTVAR